MQSIIEETFEAHNADTECFCGICGTVRALRSADELLKGYDKTIVEIETQMHPMAFSVYVNMAGR